MARYVQVWLMVVFCARFAACSSPQPSIQNPQPRVIHDTLKLATNITDTVYLDQPQDDPYLEDKLPDWVRYLPALNGNLLYEEYLIESRQNPFYLEEDFNGDHQIDVAVAVRQVESGKIGFVIIHGGSGEMHVIGAGTRIKNGLSDDLSYIDIWKLNRQRINKPGVGETTGNGPDGTLILNLPSLHIRKSDVGGGQVYWDGKEYAYFHQTC